MATTFTAPGPEILKTPEAFLATMDLRVLLTGVLDGITTADVAAVYHHHGLHGATRKALADHLYNDAARQTLGAATHGVVTSDKAMALDRLRMLLNAGVV